jgi:hypothetical protein
VFPDPTVRKHIYRDYGIFLAVAVVLSFVYNAWAFKKPFSQFKAVPLREVYEEADVIEEELPLPVEPHLPHHPTHPDLPFHHEESGDE